MHAVGLPRLARRNPACVHQAGLIKQQEFSDPAFVDYLEKHNDYNRRIFDYLRREALSGRGVLLSLTDCYRLTSYGKPIVAVKSFILSPFVDEEHVQIVVDKVREAEVKVPVNR